MFDVWIYNLTWKYLNYVVLCELQSSILSYFTDCIFPTYTHYK